MKYSPGRLGARPGVVFPVGHGVPRPTHVLGRWRHSSWSHYSPVQSELETICCTTTHESAVCIVPHRARHAVPLRTISRGFRGGERRLAAAAGNGMIHPRCTGQSQSQSQRRGPKGRRYENTRSATRNTNHESRITNHKSRITNHTSRYPHKGKSIEYRTTIAIQAARHSRGHAFRRGHGCDRGHRFGL